MEYIFVLGEGERAQHIQQMMKNYGCTYICLWEYLSSSNCLRYIDGFYHERSNQPSSSSSGTVPRRLFQEYSQSNIAVGGSFIPGIAFVSRNSSMVLQSDDLQKMAFSDSQSRFYQEARIKSAVFMGCDRGEIEIGFSDNSYHQVKEMEMRSWSFRDANRQLPLPILEVSQQPIADQNMPTSSSSSLRSLSYDSSEYSPMIFDPTASYLVPEQQQQQQQAAAQQSLGLAQTVTAAMVSTHQQAIRTISQLRSGHLPPIENEDAAVTEAILAVISNPSSTSSSWQPQQQNLPPNDPISGSQGSAFRGYRPAALVPVSRPNSSRTRRQNMLKKSFAFLSTLYSMRSQGQTQSGRTSNTQLHHMIAERRRREKLNESFGTLRSLLPPGTKKDKASVLASTTEYLKSLITQVAELIKRNQILEAQLLPQKSVLEETSNASSSSSNERVEVQLTNVAASSSSSTGRYANLQVTVRGDISLGDLVARLLEFLRSDHNVNLMSLEADTRIADTALVNIIVMRLRIEDGEWDESAFRETIRRVVNDFVEKP